VPSPPAPASRCRRSTSPEVRASARTAAAGPLRHPLVLPLGPPVFPRRTPAAAPRSAVVLPSVLSSMAGSGLPRACSAIIGEARSGHRPPRRGGGGWWLVVWRRRRLGAPDPVPLWVAPAPLQLCGGPAAGVLTVARSSAGAPLCWYSVLLPPGLEATTAPCRWATVLCWHLLGRYMIVLELSR